MTHTTDEITRGQQWNFWRREIEPGHRYEVYLLYDEECAAGYGLLKRDGHKKWMTAGLAEAYRGKGLSRLLIQFITEIAYAEPCEVWIDVWADNLALRGDIHCGYEVVREEGRDGRRLLIMRHNRDRQLRQTERALLGMPASPSDIRSEIDEVDAILRAA